MAFGIDRQELRTWKNQVDKGEIAFLTHYWIDKRFPQATSVTKVGCSDLQLLVDWGKQYNLEAKWIHRSRFPHFDLFGEKQKEVLLGEGCYDHIKRFLLR